MAEFDLRTAKKFFVKTDTEIVTYDIKSVTRTTTGWTVKTMGFGARSLNPGDVLPPSLPVVTATLTGRQQITVTWPASTDATGVKEYRIRKRGDTDYLTHQPTDRSHVFSSLQPESSYQYEVCAVDTYDNVSLWGVSNSVTTLDVLVPPTWSVAPTSVTLPSTGGTIQFTAVDTNVGETLTYSLGGTRTGFSINSATGLVSVSPSAAGTSGNIQVNCTDGTFTISTTCSVTVEQVVGPDPPATFTIPVYTAGERTFDGGNLNTGFAGSQWPIPNGESVRRLPRGGDIIELAAGRHNAIVFTRMEGSPGNRLIVRGSRTGLVTIRRTSTGSSQAPLVFEGRHTTLDGYLASAERGCGIFITYPVNASTTDKDAPTHWISHDDSPAWLSAWNASKVTANPDLSLRKPTSFHTTRYIKIDGGHSFDRDAPDPYVNSLSTNGIGVQCNDHESYKYTENNSNGVPTLYRESIIFEYIWLRNVQGEGFYMGPNWRYTTPTNGPTNADDIPLRNFTVRYNFLENIGGDALSLKSCIAGDNRIHGNRIINCTSEWGYDGSHVVGGIDSPHSTCKIYDNYLETGATPAISSYSGEMPNSLPWGPFPCEVYNNIIVDFEPAPARPTSPAINVAGNATSMLMEAKIYNNTLVDIRNTNAIQMGSNVLSSSYVKNNLLADASGIVRGSGSAPANNLTTSISAAKFVSYANRNFRLQADSPARNTVTSNYPANDFYGVTRPQGASADQGAAEYDE